MSSPIGTIELAATCLAVIGALAVSYVESCIMSKSGPKEQGKDMLIDIYWRNLEIRERVFFWAGSFFLMSPFFLFPLI